MPWQEKWEPKQSCAPKLAHVATLRSLELNISGHPVMALMVEQSIKKAMRRRGLRSVV